MSWKRPCSMMSPVMITTRGARRGQRLADAVEEPDPVELARHADVGQDHVVGVLGAHLERLGAVLRHVHVVAVVLERAPRRRGRSRRRPRAPAVGPGRLARVPRLGGGGSAAGAALGTGRRIANVRAPPGLGLDLDRAAVVAHDAEADAQAQARAVLLAW